MKTNQTNEIMNTSLVRIAIGTAAVLMIPLILQFPWTLSDFVLMGILLFGAGTAIDYSAKNVDKKYRLAVILAVIFGFLIIWLQMAVRLVGKIFIGSQCVVMKGISVQSVISCNEELRQQFEGLD